MFDPKLSASGKVDLDYTVSAKKNKTKQNKTHDTQLAPSESAQVKSNQQEVKGLK